MRHETKLLKILDAIGYPKPKDVDWHEFMRCKSYRLYAKYPEFKDFLDRHTKFLYNVHATQRWLHYLHGYSKPHSCQVCHKYIKDFKDKYCSHACSTLAPKTGNKTGPKVDLAEKKKQLILSLPVGYKLVEYRYRVKCVFKHECGSTFEMYPRPLLDGSGSCHCQHKKLTKHTIKSLQDWHNSRKTGYNVLKIAWKKATIQCNKCNHKFTTRKFYDRRCPSCFPNIFSTQAWDPKLYANWIKRRQPDFVQIDCYTDSKTPIRFKHKVCKEIFSVLTPTIARPSFKCPACSPKTCGAYHKFKRGRTVLDVRGKESIALAWILKHTSYTLNDIVVDSEGLVPRIRYRSLAGATQEYRPDFYMVRINTIVEVKDFNTLGLRHEFFYKSPKQLWETNCRKAKACIGQGYKFRMMLFNTNNILVKLPNEWYNLTHKQITNWIKQVE